MLTCEATKNGMPFPLANTTFGQAMSIGDNMKDGAPPAAATTTAASPPPLTHAPRHLPAVLTEVRDDAQEEYDKIPPSQKNSQDAQELEDKIRKANATLEGVDRLDDHIETLLDCKFFRKAFRGLKDVLCGQTYKSMVRAALRSAQRPVPSVRPAHSPAPPPPPRRCTSPSPASSPPWDWRLAPSP